MRATWIIVHYDILCIKCIKNIYWNVQLKKSITQPVLVTSGSYFPLLHKSTLAIRSAQKINPTVSYFWTLQWKLKFTPQCTIHAKMWMGTSGLVNGYPLLRIWWPWRRCHNFDIVDYLLSVKFKVVSKRA